MFIEFNSNLEEHSALPNVFHKNIDYIPSEDVNLGPERHLDASVYHRWLLRGWPSLPLWPCTSFRESWLFWPKENSVEVFFLKCNLVSNSWRPKIRILIILPHLFSYFHKIFGFYVSYLSDHALIGHAMLTTLVVDEFDCHFKCISKSCKSFNVRPSDSNGNRICELNNETRQMKPSDFKQKKGSTYYASVQVGTNYCNWFFY